MMNGKVRVGVVFGGKTSEHEVSLASAQSVMRALDSSRYETVMIGVTKEGRWLIGGNALQQLLGASRASFLPSAGEAGAASPDPNTKELVSRDAAAVSTGNLLKSSVDVVFPVIHGPFGEDGTIQGLLELADIPYVGAGVAASAVGMDKALMKSIFQSAGLPLGDYLVVLRHRWEQFPEETLREIEASINYPCFVKPANLGSSIGIVKAHDRLELEQGLATSTRYDRKLMVERAIVGREVECSVLGNDEPSASTVGEIISGHEFYDYESKYSDESGTRLIIPADISPEQESTVQDLAVRAFKAIDACGMARVDFFIRSSDGRVILNEINTIPGFTIWSMYPKLWVASGLPYPQLVDRLIELALERHADKKRNRTG
jgi:D-alanine-D-alanine ligase